MSGWVQARVEDLKDEETRRGPHSYRGFHGNHGFPQFCRYCGFIYLKNEIGELVNRAGCSYKSDLLYKNWLKNRHTRR